MECSKRKSPTCEGEALKFRDESFPGHPDKAIRRRAAVQRGVAAIAVGLEILAGWEVEAVAFLTAPRSQAGQASPALTG